MKSDIACVVPIFNYTGDKLLEQNHSRSLAGLKEPGVDIYSIRASQDWFPHGDWVMLVAKDVLWQKEALINAAASRLRGDYSIIAWVDSGILLTPSWSSRVRKQLETHDVVQCFSRGIWLTRNGTPASFRRGYVAHYLATCPGATEIPRPHGPKPSVGGAWASRSDLWNKTNLYDRAIVGGGDTWALNGFLRVNTPEALATRYLTPEHRRDICHWINCVRALALRVGYIEGEYTHLWHTPQGQRRHSERHQILQSRGFDPEAHTCLVNGLVGWTPQAPTELRDAVERYILGRSLCPEHSSQRERQMTLF